MKKNDMAEFQKSFWKDFLEALSEFLQDQGKEEITESPAVSVRDEMFPKEPMFDPENIDYNHPAFASGVSLGLPKEISVNKFSSKAKLSGYGYSLSKGKKGVKFNQDMGDE